LFSSSHYFQQKSAKQGARTQYESRIPDLDGRGSLPAFLPCVHAIRATALRPSVGGSAAVDDDLLLGQRHLPCHSLPGGLAPQVSHLVVCPFMLPHQWNPKLSHVLLASGIRNEQVLSVLVGSPGCHGGAGRTAHLGDDAPPSSQAL